MNLAAEWKRIAENKKPEAGRHVKTLLSHVLLLKGNHLAIFIFISSNQ